MRHEHFHTSSEVFSDRPGRRRHAHEHGHGHCHAHEQAHEQHHERDHADEHGRGHGHGHGGHHRRGRRRDRVLEYGELRLLVLALIEEEPSYGYELMKAIEERFGGGYSPSPGVIYPTLSWLEDMGYAAVDAAEGNRKRFRITDPGRAFLAANRETTEALQARMASGGHEGRPAPIVRAMENLKVALRLRFQRGPIDRAEAEAIAAAIDAAARNVEQITGRADLSSNGSALEENR